MLETTMVQGGQFHSGAVPAQTFLVPLKNRKVGKCEIPWAAPSKKKARFL
jgi:hypothetical protein